MVELVQEALRERGIDDEVVVAAGQFNPPGHSGGLFVGGLTGADAESLHAAWARALASAPGRSRASAPPTPLPGSPGKMLVGREILVECACFVLTEAADR